MMTAYAAAYRVTVVKLRLNFTRVFKVSQFVKLYEEPMRLLVNHMQGEIYLIDNH